MDYYTRLQSRLPSSSSSSSSSSATFPPHRTQLHPRMHYSPTTATRPSPSRLDQRWRLAAAAALILPFLFYLFAAALRTHLSPRFGAPSPKGFGVVIEAGRDGSRVRVFEYLSEGGIPFVAGFDGRGRAASMKVRPGMRAFVDEPDGAGKSLLELLDFARRTVPRSEWGQTKVRLLLETSGLDVSRLDVWQAVLESCRKVLRSSGFLFKDEWASQITGDEKGVYTWVAANYALGTLGKDPEQTTGIVELKEDSTQITFVPSELASKESFRVVNLPGISYHLYTSTIRHLSQERAWEFLNNIHNPKVSASSTDVMKMSTISPCIPRGYTLDNFSSTSSNVFADSLGNYSDCKAKALALLKEQGSCSHPPCGIISMLKSRLQGRLIHSKNIIYFSELFGLVPKRSLTELESAGKRYCQNEWTTLREVHPGIDEADLLKYCFSSAYIIALLHDGLGIPMEDKRIGLRDQSESAPLDWTLGAFILQTVTVPLLEAESIDHMAGNDSITYIVLFAFLIVGILAIFIVLRWQRPQLKMIYDLEKGHYIVTRIPR